MSTLLNTRIRLRYDTYTNWSTINPVLLEGEVAIVVPGTEFGNEGHKTSTAPCLMKVGKGGNIQFNDLPWLSAVAADVHTWAKKSEAEFKEWLDKTAKFATDEELAAVASRVTTLENELNGVGETTGLKARMTAVEGRATELENRATAVEGRATTLEGKVEALEALTGGEGTDSLNYRVAALEKDNTDNKSNISTNATAIENITKAETGAIAVAVKAEENRAKLAEEGLQTNLTNAIAKEVSDRDAAILVETNARVAAINGVNAAIEEEASRATVAEGGLSTRIKTIEDDYLKGADKTELQGNIDTLAGVVETLTDGIDPDKVDGINDLIAYVEEHGPQVTKMLDDIADNASGVDANAKAIAQEILDRKAADEALGERIDADVKALADYKAEIGFEKADKTLMAVITDTYATKSDVTDAVSGINSAASALEGRVKANEDKLVGITTTVVAAIEAAQSAAEGKVTALENGKVKENADAIAAINHASTGILAQAKKYTDDEIDKVESAATLLGNRVTANETLLAGIGGENQPATVVAAIAAAKNAAEQKVTDLANGQVNTNKLAIEAINNESTGILANAKSYTDTKIGEVNSAIAKEKSDREAFDAKTLTGVKDGDNLAISLNGTALGTLVFVCGGADID